VSIYYSPESRGLITFDALQEDLSYEFNIIWIARHVDSGELFWAHDSGCSCPTPFEDYEFNYVNDNGRVILNTNMYMLRPDTFDSFEAEVLKFPVTKDRAMDVIWKVKHNLKVA
jgi:hypothetical protein